MDMPQVRKGKAAVQRVMGYMRKAITEFRMIENGDRIAVGVSGGKDSVALLVGLQQLRRFIGIEYEVVALTLDPGFGGQETDYSAIAALCAEYSIPYELRRTQIGKIVFDERKEKHPCSLCARLRRGALHDSAKELSCNKLALGHHINDVVETFMLNLFKEGRIGCFAPVTYLSRKDLTMIRPLVFAPEKEISAAIRKNGLPVVKSICPADGATAREEMKSFLREREREDHGFTYRMFGALRRSGVDGWGYPESGLRNPEIDGKVRKTGLPAGSQTRTQL